MCNDEDFIQSNIDGIECNMDSSLDEGDYVAYRNWFSIYKEVLKFKEESVKNATVIIPSHTHNIDLGDGKHFTTSKGGETTIPSHTHAF